MSADSPMSATRVSAPDQWLASVDPHQLRSWTKRYAPVILDLQDSLKAELGLLSWSELAMPEGARREDRRPAIRVASIQGRGVLLPGLDLTRLTRVVNSVLRRHSFEAQPQIVGNEFGILTCSSQDQWGAEFSLASRSTLNAWIDLTI